MRFSRIGYYVLTGICGTVRLATIFGFFVMLHWNWLIPGLFSLPNITSFQSVGIIILIRLIFGGFKHDYPKPSHHNDHFSRKWKSRYKHIKNHENDFGK